MKYKKSRSQAHDNYLTLSVSDNMIEVGHKKTKL